MVSIGLQYSQSLLHTSFRNAESTHRGHAGPVPTHYLRRREGRGKWVAATAFRVAVDIMGKHVAGKL